MTHLVVRRAVTLAPATLDRDAGTVEVVLSTGADVDRGGFTERLLVGCGNVELPSGGSVPLLDSHSQGSVFSTLGRVDGFRFEGSQIIGTLHVSNAAALDLIERGQITGVSIGYRVLATQDATDRATGKVTRTVTRWSLAEVSLVAVPADPHATMRSLSMPDLIPAPVVVPVVAPLAPLNERAQVNVAIRQLGTQHQLGNAWADHLIDSGATVEAARSAALDVLSSRSPIIVPHQRAGTADRAADLEARSVALAHRMDPRIAETEASRAYRHHTLLDHARDALEAQGVSTRGMSRDELATRAGQATTSDFPSLLTSAGNRVLAAPYVAAQSPLKQLFRQRTLNDFRPGSTIRLSDMPRLAKVAEGGEITYGARGEVAQGLKLDTYARIFGLSRQAIINDDLGAFSDWSAQFAIAAAETENDLRVGLLRLNGVAGPTMDADGKPLFDPSHNNLGAPVTLSVAAISAGRLALRTQFGIDGKTLVGATPQFLVVGPLLETLAEQLLAGLAATETDNVNPFSGRLTLLVEPRFGATSKAWYLAADPAVLPSFQEAYLSGAPGPQMASRDGWDVLGTEFRCILDYGCGALDWRGIYRNPGA